MQPSVDEFADHLAGSLLAFDFDGTLSPLVLDPADSRLADGVATALAELAERGAQVAIVTGREAETALKLSGLAAIPRLVVSGLHGAEQWRDGSLVSREEPAGISELRSTLPSMLAQVDPDVWLEDKRLSLVVHARRSAHPDTSLNTLSPLITAAARSHGLEVVPGKLVLEIRIPNLSKADALASLLTPQTTAALFAGDDVGDLPAFAELKRWQALSGRPVLRLAVGEVAEVRAAADLTLDSPAELSLVLQRLASH
jgi:trehalose 6-phosphate phosphatase